MSRIELTANTFKTIGPSGDWQTFQQAWDDVHDNYDLRGKYLTITVAPGVYAPFVAFGAITGMANPGSLRFVGNEANPSTVTIKATSGPCVAMWEDAAMRLDGFQYRASGSGTQACGIICSDSRLYIGASGWNHCTRAYIDCISNRGKVTITDNQVMYGNTQYAWLVEDKGQFNANGKSFTLAGNIAFDTFVYADQGAVVEATGSNYNYNGFSATGAQYRSNQACIRPGNAPFFGNVGGSVAFYGVYNPTI